MLDPSSSPLLGDTACGIKMIEGNSSCCLVEDSDSMSVCSPLQVLLSPDMDFDQSESDQDISGLQGTNQKMKQPSYHVVI